MAVSLLNCRPGQVWNAARNAASGVCLFFRPVFTRNAGTPKDPFTQNLQWHNPITQLVIGLFHTMQHSSGSVSHSQADGLSGE